MTDQDRNNLVGMVGLSEAEPNLSKTHVRTRAFGGYGAKDAPNAPYGNSDTLS
jgi:hypothetical protein